MARTQDEGIVGLRQDEDAAMGVETRRDSVQDL